MRVLPICQYHIRAKCCNLYKQKHWYPRFSLLRLCFTHSSIFLLCLSSLQNYLNLYHHVQYVMHEIPLQTIKSFFNRNINTSAIWLPLKKQMRWKQSIKIEIFYRRTEEEKNEYQTDVLSAYNTRTNSNSHWKAWKAKRSVITTKDKMFFVCVFYRKMDKEKRWHAFNITLRAARVYSCCYSFELSFISVRTCLMYKIYLAQ